MDDSIQLLIHLFDLRDAGLRQFNRREVFLLQFVVSLCDGEGGEQWKVESKEVES